MPEVSPESEESHGLSTGSDRLPTASGVHVARAGTGESITASGVEHVFPLGSNHTQGRLSVETFTVLAGSLGAPPHIHGSHDECFVVLTGELTVASSSGEICLGPGDLGYAPRGTLHGFRNAHKSAPVTAMCISTPAGYEQFFRDVEAATNRGDVLDDAAMAALRGRYDTRTPRPNLS